MKQLLTFFGLAYLISWAIWLPLYGHIFGLTNLPTLPFHHGIGGLGPLITVWGILTIIIFKPKNLATNDREKIDYPAFEILSK